MPQNSPRLCWVFGLACAVGLAAVGVGPFAPPNSLTALAQAAAKPAAKVAARTTSTPQASVELVSASDRAVAGQTLWLGLRIRLAEGWHIYWVNPGDSGGPPTMAWSLPPGFSAGAFVWPTPRRIPVGTLVNYGYDGDVTLPVPIQIPSNYDGGPITLGARARWLACKDLCVSQQGQLALALPLARADAGSRQDWAQRIQAARAAEPTAAPRAWRARVSSGRDAFTLRVDLDRAAQQAYFFPLDESQVNDSAKQVVTTSGRRLEIVLRKSPQLTRDPARLRGVLKLESGVAHVIEAPVSVSP